MDKLIKMLAQACELAVDEAVMYLEHDDFDATDAERMFANIKDVCGKALDAYIDESGVCPFCDRDIFPDPAGNTECPCKEDDE